MIRKWVKILPYWVVMFFVKKFSPHLGKLNNDVVYLWRIDKGEFLVFSKMNYEILQEREMRKKKKKVNKKFKRIMKEISKDYDLDKTLKEYYEQQIKDIENE